MRSISILLAVALAARTADAKPAYCGAKSYAKRTAKELHHWYDDPKQRHDLYFLVNLHRGLCSTDTPPADRAEIESMRKTLLGELGLTDADTADLRALLDYDQADTFPSYFWFGEPPTVKGEAKAGTTSPVDQLHKLAAVRNDFYVTHWLVDAWGDTLTESARAAYVHHCVKDAYRGVEAVALDYAWCADDARRLDRAKFAKEVAPLAPELRIAAKLELAGVIAEAAAVEAEIAKKPELAKATITQPRAIADDWRAYAKDHAATLDHVRAVELAWIDGDGESPATCRQTLADDWKRAIADTKIVKDSAPSLGVAASSRTAYLVSVGMERCTRKLDGYKGLSEMIGESIDRQPFARGPRSEGFEAAVVALSQHGKKADTRRMESTDIGFLPIRQSNGHSARFAAHTVASMTKTGDKVRLHFKKEKIDYDVCTKEEPSGRWIIRGNTIEQETHCVALATKSTMEAVADVEIPADLAATIKVGNAVALGEGNFPIETWADAHQKKLLGLYGTSR